MDYKRITELYYECWLGKTGVLSMPGIQLIESQERNQAQPGYGTPYALWIWRTEKSLLISYGEKAAPSIHVLAEKLSLTMSNEELMAAIESVYGGQVEQGIKYVYAGPSAPESRAKVLTAEDYPLYKDFFEANNPSMGEAKWLREYFDEMVEAGVCCGMIEDGKLASCTDAPTMPYMAEEVQEVGINTLPEYRRKHLAAEVVRRCIGQIIQQGKCPMWSTSAGNIPSQRLAERVGFEKIADYFTLYIK